MSRWLMVLVALQTVLVLVLLFKVIELENHIASLTLTTPNAASLEISGVEPMASADDDEWLDEGRLRRIMAEEIQRAISRLPLAASHDKPETETPQVSPAEYRARLDHALTQLEYYVGKGEISPAEMANLQLDIARLDEENRSEVLRLLVKAVSTGKLEGEL